MPEYAHLCPGPEPSEAARLTELLLAEPWLVRTLDAVAASGLPDAWVGAGAIRDVVWGRLYGRFSPDSVRDIDVAFFDLADISPARDAAAQGALSGLARLPWEATNQAAVHTWYHLYFGGRPVEPFTSVHDAVATWPETATCVAVRWGALSGLEVCAPHGVTDLLSGVWRINPARVTPEVSRERLARQRIQDKWPGVTVVLAG